MFDQNHPLEDLIPASYNPRFCSDEAIGRLCKSIEQVGMVKPVIVRGQTLVAGHQRTKALARMGVKTVPAFLLGSDVNMWDEVRFNQLHNGTDLDSYDEHARVEGPIQLGFQMVDASRLSGDLGASYVLVRQTIEQLVRRYGGWGACVATQSGELIHCAQYALAAMNLRVPVLIYGIKDEDRDTYVKLLGGQYGVFSYGHFAKETTYIQTLAQPRRRVGTEDRKGHLQSSLYKVHVFPWLGDNKRLRGIDFGAGTGAHAADLRKRGFDFLDVELFRRAKGSQSIDVAQVNAMIDTLCRQWGKRGPFDFVVCDSVVNSVDSKDAEKAVMTTLNALCRMGGRLFFSGRTLELVADRTKTNKTAGLAKETMHMEFLDNEGFTGYYRLGHWFYQLYHDRAGARRLAEEFGFKIERHNHTESKGFGWQIVCDKVAELPAEQVKWALEFEFNMPVSKQRRLERHNDVIAAWTTGRTLDVGCAPGEEPQPDHAPARG